MSILGNILWFICGGLLSGLSWVLAGCLWCISIIGIPIGLQCFKFAGLAFFPFGKEVVYGGGAVSLIANIIWLIVSGIPMAVGNAVAGLVIVYSAGSGLGFLVLKGFFDTIPVSLREAARLEGASGFVVSLTLRYCPFKNHTQRSFSGQFLRSCSGSASTNLT